MGIERIETATLRKEGENWLVITQAAVEALNNAEAAAAYLYLMSKPPGWVVRSADLKKRWGWGRDKTQKALKTLRDAGLSAYEVSRDEKGKIIDRQIVIYAVPRADDLVPENPAHGTVGLKTRSLETCSLENPRYGKSGPLVIKDLPSNKLNTSNDGGGGDQCAVGEIGGEIANSSPPHSAPVNQVVAQKAVSVTPPQPTRPAVIDLNFQPNQETRQWLYQHRIPDQFINDQIPEFISYWRELGVKRPTWQNTFLKNVKKNWERAQANGNHHGSNQHEKRNTSRSRSAAGRVSENAERERREWATASQALGGQPVGEDGAAVWPQVDDGVWGRDRPDRHVGEDIDGDYTRADS